MLIWRAYTISASALTRLLDRVQRFWRDAQVSLDDVVQSALDVAVECVRAAEDVDQLMVAVTRAVSSLLNTDRGRGLQSLHKFTRTLAAINKGTYQ